MTAYVLVSTATLLITGWLAGAESASFGLVQPVIDTLAADPQVRMHRGMLTTFGRVMPLLMPTCAILTVVSAILAPEGPQRAAWLAAAGCQLAQTLTTLAVNVPINTRTGTWDPTHPPAGWQDERRRWHRFQGFRATMLSLAFVCAAFAVVSAHPG